MWCGRRIFSFSRPSRGRRGGNATIPDSKTVTRADVYAKRRHIARVNRLIRRAVAFAVWACLGLSVAVPIQAQVWAPVSRISNTIGNNAGRVCVGGGADFVGCPSQSLYVTSGGQVGINTTSPLATLHVAGTVSVTGALQVGTSSLTCVSGISGSIRYSQISSTMEYCNSTAWVSMGPSSTQPISFKATNGSAQSFSANTTTKLNFATEEFDTNNNFASSRFTATVPGKYLFTASALLTGVTGGADIYIFKNGTYSGIGSAINGNVTKSGLSASGVLDLAVNDYVEVYGWVGSGSPVHYQSYNQFSGVLLSPQDSGGGGAGTLNDLSDVDTPTQPLPSAVGSAGL